MEFLLTRTSKWEIETLSDLDLKQEDIEYFNIIEKTYDYIDKRGFKTPEEYNAKLRDNWFDKGTDHKITKYGIQRVFKDQEKGFFIEVNSLEDLIRLFEHYGKIIINNNYYNENIKNIEIYDDYRE
jgi:hypothetical protein